MGDQGMGGRCFFFFLLLSIPQASQQHRLLHHHARRSHSRLPPHPAISPLPPHPAISPLASPPAISPLAPRPAISPLPPHPAIIPLASHPAISPLPPHPAISPLASHPAISPLGPHPAISPLAPHPAATAPSGEGQDPDTADEFLSSHNQVRATIGEPPFVWDEALAEYARRWSDLRRSDCAMEHSQGPYGENLFWGSGQDWKAADAVENWAAERDNYNSSDNSCAPGKMCGHFTQIVWNSTTRVGCARVECIAGAGVFVICDYDPPGNWVDERPFNVNT